MMSDRDLEVTDRFGLRNKGRHSGPPPPLGAKLTQNLHETISGEELLQRMAPPWVSAVLAENLQFSILARLLLMNRAPPLWS